MKAQIDPQLPASPLPLVSKLASGTSALATNADTSEDSQIRELAYKLYEQRGRVDGSDLQDWFEAELILRERGNAAS